MTLQKKRVSRRQHLIEIGLELFSARSYDEVAIDDIADLAEISKGLLYYYFPTKHDFYVAVVRQAAEQLLEMTDADETLRPIERLRYGLSAYFRYVEQHASTYLALMRGGVGADAEVAAIVDEARQKYVQRVLQGLPGGEAPELLRLAVHGWVGFVESLSVAWVKEREVEAETLCELAVATFLTTLQKARVGQVVDLLS